MISANASSSALSLRSFSRFGSMPNDFSSFSQKDRDETLNNKSDGQSVDF